MAQHSTYYIDHKKENLHFWAVACDQSCFSQTQAPASGKILYSHGDVASAVCGGGRYENAGTKTKFCPIRSQSLSWVNDLTAFNFTVGD